MHAVLLPMTTPTGTPSAAAIEPQMLDHRFHADTLSHYFMPFFVGRHVFCQRRRLMYHLWLFCSIYMVLSPIKT